MGLVFEKNTFFAPYKQSLERLKNRERTKGIHESPTKKKVGRQGRKGYCGLCVEKCHSSKKCLHEVCLVSISQEDRTKRKKLGKEAQVNVEPQA
ncbi:hypothetical protein HID58_074870 [Brassica napus]|uniref:Uncharacterized protein n=1 Tax=Brassica napus TaxID=3708 RepID=A0ABQ7YI96_BRANA|nr:hypothetical protein HID58_074870 [Brassica napus]